MYCRSVVQKKMASFESLSIVGIFRSVFQQERFADMHEVDVALSECAVCGLLDASGGVI